MEKEKRCPNLSKTIFNPNSNTETFKQDIFLHKFLYTSACFSSVSVFSGLKHTITNYVPISKSCSFQ